MQVAHRALCSSNCTNSVGRPLQVASRTLLSFRPSATAKPSQSFLSVGTRIATLGATQSSGKVPLAGRTTVTPPQATANGMAGQREEIATLGGGCFWCVEAVFNSMKGVYNAISGYEGGHVDSPTYEQVCNKTTGHAEVVLVKFDPDVIDYRTILQVFFSIHDPTTLNRQGNDVGPQYRSCIMYHSEEQKRIAEEVMREVAEEKVWGSAPLVTELVPTQKFWPAEKYHQRYYVNNPNQGYCSYVVGPKVAKFRAKWKHLLVA